MQFTQIDRLPVAQLPSRYGISRTVLYERFAALKIEPERRGNKAYVNAQQLELLDGLHEHLHQGGSTADFLERTGLLAVQSTGQPSKLSAELSTGQLAAPPESVSLSVLVEAIAAKLASPAPDLLACFRVLEEACQHRWLLSTSHLSWCLGLSPKTLGSYDSFERYGFRFAKCGRNGSETAWAITKSQC